MTTSTTSQEMPTAQTLSRQKRRLFYIINAIIIIAVSGSMITNKFAEFNDALYVILLGFICTLPVLFTTSYRGKQSLMLLFLAFYFSSFGLKDISSFIANEPISRYEPDALFSGGEIAILLGAICFILGYVIISKFSTDRSKGIMIRDWSHKSMTILGFSFWLIGIYIETTLRFGVLDMMANVTATSATGFIILLRYLQPLGSLILIYLLLTTRKKSVLIIFIITVLIDFSIGFIGDSKVIAVRAPLLYLFSFVLLRERVPLIKTVVFILVAGLMFNVFDAYRSSLHLSKDTRSESFMQIGSKLDKIAEEDKSTTERLSEGLIYFADRVTLKNYVELLLVRVGKDIDFLHGETIQPIIYAFIPRFILPDKPATNQLGQLFNRTFKISASDKTFIALSQLGELYWNYSWTGLIIGMMLIGAFMALIASILRLDTIQTLPRFLLLLMTVYLLTLSFETAIAQSYTLWGRFFILMILLNFFIPKEKNKNSQPIVTDHTDHTSPRSERRIIAYKNEKSK